MKSFNRQFAFFYLWFGFLTSPGHGVGEPPPTAATSVGDHSPQEKAAPTTETKPAPPSIVEHTVAFLTKTQRPENSDKGALRLMISVTWEGTSLEKPNLDALLDFRAANPNLRLHHLLSPAYFARNETVRNESLGQILSVIKPGDSIGINFVPWRSIVTAAGIPFKTEKTFWGSPINIRACTVDCGQETSLSHYDSKEQVAIIEQTLKLFTAIGFQPPKEFRMAGWLSGLALQEIASKYGLTHDFSPIPPALTKRNLGSFPLAKWVDDAWPSISVYSQPFRVVLSDPKINMVGVPNNAGVADLVTTRDLLTIFNSYMRLAKQDPNRMLYVHLNINQETAARFVNRVQESIRRLVSAADKYQIPIESFSLNPAKTLPKAQDPTAAQDPPDNPQTLDSH